jgi:two-component system phosphate regulon response regulator PhoB
MLTQKLLRKLLRLTLSYGIYRMYEADNGKDALEMANAEHPDVMILDVTMPGGINGLQVCEALKKDPKLSSIFVVLLSARGQKSDIEAGRQAGADAYIVKPFRPGHLIEVIESRRGTYG